MQIIREVHESSLPITLAYYGKDEYVPWIAAEMKVESGRGYVASTNRRPWQHGFCPTR